MKKRNVILLVLLLVIGFASVSTTLILNGTIGIGAKTDDFDVIFTSAKLDGEYSENVTLSENKKSITFTTDRLRELNEKAILDYKVKNNSTQYGANVTISCNSYGNEYIEITGEFDGNTIPLNEPVEVEAQEVKSGYINAELVKVYGGEDDSIDITCMITASATSKEGETDFVPYKLYKEEVLNGADPVLTSSGKTRSVSKELIPVTIGNDGTVTYANVENKWYDYENKEWANAIILIDNSSKKYRVNDEIKEEDIESYFVWVPRYRYQIFDEGNYTEATESTPTKSNAQEIQIVFESKDTTPSNGSTKGTWLTHPAFTNFDVNGLWIGKFETGYDGANTKEEAQVNENDSSKVVIKPNVYSWRNITVANMFKTSYNYNRDMDSHMMKNTEWGAVAYLSHSKYGINKEININNNSDYLTGYSAAEGTDQSSKPGTSGTTEDITLPYNTATGYKASTTGNITGVYDMSGGAYEQVAGYMLSSKDKSEFTSDELEEYKNYLDKYPNTSTITSWNNRILGDATGEIGPFYYYKDKDNNDIYYSNWYGDHAGSIQEVYPWFHRGGYNKDGILAGQFNIARYSGKGIDSMTYRLVLAP